MAIVKRFPVGKPPVKKGNIVRRSFAQAEKKFADNIEEYVFALPREPMLFREMVLNWIVPYQQNHFVMFGQAIKLSPHYVHDGDKVRITGVLVEIVSGRPKRKIIEGSRGVFYGQIKFFVKSNMKG